MTDKVKSTALVCNRCGSTELGKDGWRFRGGAKVQNYQCRKCGRKQRYPEAISPTLKY